MMQDMCLSASSGSDGGTADKAREGPVGGPQCPAYHIGCPRRGGGAKTCVRALRCQLATRLPSVHSMCVGTTRGGIAGHRHEPRRMRGWARRSLRSMRRAVERTESANPRGALRSCRAHRAQAAELGGSRRARGGLTGERSSRKRRACLPRSRPRGQRRRRTTARWRQGTVERRVPSQPLMISPPFGWSTWPVM
jgi:hypothetical protein